MIKKIWQDPVWSKIIATAILAVLTSLGTYLFDVWPAISQSLQQMWCFTLESTLVPNWLLGITLFFILLFCTRMLFTREACTKTPEPYTRDNFFGLLWSWRYVNGKGNGRITDLKCLCPKCEYEITPKLDSGYRIAPSYNYSCDDCGFSAGSLEDGFDSLKNKVWKKIEQGLRKRG